jgi:hypothetical protein
MSFILRCKTKRPPPNRGIRAIVPLPNRDAADPHKLLFESTEAVSACYNRGQEISNGS